MVQNLWHAHIENLSIDELVVCSIRDAAVCRFGGGALKYQQISQSRKTKPAIGAKHERCIFRKGIRIVRKGLYLVLSDL